MAKKKESKPRTPARFATGAQVRVKPGATDPDFPDIPLGLTSDDPLPEVDDDTLRAYHRYLVAYLAFPCDAKWEPEYGPAQTVKITGLGDPEDDAWADEMYGLLCEARVEGRLTEVPLGECEAKKGSPNRQRLKDYSYWFWNNR